MSHHDSHQLNRQTPVSGAPAASPGTGPAAKCGPVASPGGLVF
ncbi:hypothetical protein N7366_25465 [Aeromonas caviae]|nr:hypothetical protein [Aeromonas caviae]MDH0436505.1 hypothetical protein [Aeromonas caviae]MDH0477454.1 hypothetical protein [Aeromonas caviae]MDH0939167.1 hypothetical protein [Aeromonas caviae]MDH1399981.1 hypothetical protein [Aeromonas caviae]MDH1807263.1 hypothetical protein [Aeromonas caviae]